MKPLRLKDVRYGLVGEHIEKARAHRAEDRTGMVFVGCERRRE